MMKKQPKKPIRPLSVLSLELGAVRGGRAELGTLRTFGKDVAPVT